ncbi:MAG TPA: class I SAM-dependent methyltransferase [Candidatus Polarisedimenticolaceae bacterium]|nr:class I SAM-dependent methyltransferase [Candidatus Polarisedimenticolaceae bacterium]
MRAGFRLFLLGAAVLFWELLFIRWMGSCIRIVGYYTNFILIAAFLGLGAGALLAGRRPDLRGALVPAIAGSLIAAPVLGAFLHANPTHGEYLWSGNLASENLGFLGMQTSIELPYGLLLAAAFAMAALVFVIFGQWVGALFLQFPPLTGYSLEIGGSVLGILLFAALSLFGLPPSVWLLLGFALLAALLPPRTKAWLGALACMLPALAFCSAFERQFLWSPYYKIRVQPLFASLGAGTSGSPAGYDLTVNSDFHQKVIDLRPRAAEPRFFALWRAIYEFPYRDPTSVPGPILVVGAGTGNDLSAALRRAGDPITAVEIDPVILQLGHAIHPERPYANPRVRAVNQDARAFFARGEETYAKVVFGYLDSHTLFSSLSTLRLDNFVYTVESLRRVKALLLPGGRVYLTFSSNEPWIDRRLEDLLDAVFDYDTITVRAPPGPFLGTVTYMNGKLRTGETPPPRRQRPPPSRLPSDDWPFLYLAEPGIPAHYGWFLCCVLVLSTASLALLPAGQRRIRLPYFFLGAAFFLIETSNVVKLALLYGSTWMVNVTVFAGVLLLVLLGNLVSARLPGERTGPLFAALAAACALSYLVSPSLLLPLESALVRGAAAVLLFLSPVFVASVLFARLIRRETSFPSAYGSNLLGAMLGGAAEYLSLAFGLRSLVLLAMVLYGLAWLALPRGRR